MQPREESEKPVRALAWKVECDDGLLVTLVVVDKYVILRSDSPQTGAAPWRLGAYMNAEEAARNAIDMTGSYERLRRGKVGLYAELAFPGWEWRYSVENNELHLAVTNAVEAALSPKLSPITD